MPRDDLGAGVLGFYNVSTKPYNFLISSLTFSICTFICASTFVFTVESIIFNIDSLKFSGSAAIASFKFYSSFAACSAAEI